MNNVLASKFAALGFSIVRTPSAHTVKLEPVFLAEDGTNRESNAGYSFALNAFCFGKDVGASVK
jgi:hypothetical protein